MSDALPPADQLEQIAVAVAIEAADHVRSRAGDWSAPPTKSSPTDIVTQTDLESEELIKARLAVATPDSGFVGEEGGSTEAQRRLQWVVDPLDGTVNFWYGLPVVAVSIAATIDGVVSAAAVVDVERRETFSAAAGAGARANGVPITASTCSELGQALVTTGFSYHAPIRAAQGAVVGRVLPRVRDVRCFGSAALQMCWVGLPPHRLVLRAGHEDLGLRRGVARRPGSRRSRRAALPGEPRLGDGRRAGDLRRAAPTRRRERLISASTRRAASLPRRATRR